MFASLQSAEKGGKVRKWECEFLAEESQQNISQIAAEYLTKTLVSVRRLKQTNNHPKLKISKQEWEMCVFSACLLPSVVTFSVTLSFPHVARQENLTGSAWTGWCHHDGAMQMWQLLEKCFYLLLILEGRAAAIAVAC